MLFGLDFAPNPNGQEMPLGPECAHEGRRAQPVPKLPAGGPPVAEVHDHAVECDDELADMHQAAHKQHTPLAGFKVRGPIFPGSPGREGEDPGQKEKEDGEEIVF